jgi:hypothetical protein
VKRAPRVLVLLAWALPGRAAAHGFGARYDLPIPLSLYLTGAALAVALSFVIVGFGLRASRRAARAAERSAVRVPGVLWITRLLGVAVYAMVLYAGLYGTQSPLKNIVPVLVWALWWVGMAYACALFGNVWALFNPFDALFASASAVWSRLHPASTLEMRLRYPPALGAWPAVLLFVAFVWMEIVSETSDVPATIAQALMVYSVITWLGMAMFGRDVWMQRGETFSLVFGLIARFAPIDLRVDHGRVAARMRPYAVGLLVHEPVDRSNVLLVMVLLSTVSFDGFLETPAWAAIAAPTGDSVLLKTAGLLLVPWLFLAIFLAVCRASAAAAQRRGAAGRRPATWQLAGLFANTLVPIAIAYQLAHYLSFLAMAMQYAIPLASDPLGAGSDLFGTRNHFVRPGWVEARVVWNVSVAAIVAGHVAAVYLAHVQALRRFDDWRAALRSQYPMLALMVAYTMLSLWIIAQPIVSSRFS